MIEKLLAKIDENCPSVDKKLVEKAFYLAKDAHKDQKRESGEEYIVHPLEVTCILAEMGLDTATIVAGLLHDVVEDTEYTYESVAKEFNVEVANLVEGVTKLSKIQFKTKEEQQADNVRKMLLAMTKDIRVILIKLADRLHNMRTLKFMSVLKQKEKAKETIDIYAPIAHRLGIFKIKWELEDLALRYLNPNEYYELVNKIASKRTEREEDINNILDQLNGNLSKSGIYAEIDGRPKHFYSIYKKMSNKSKTLDQIFDLMAFRILVHSIKDCYAVLGIVHTLYKPIPGRFKDYIAMPKPNMYQSLHTTVIGSNGKPFEIQIRTFDMHKTAEYGIAAHWKYKEGTNNASSGDFEGKLAWIRDVLEWQKQESNAKEFMENFKIDLFSDEVFVFTPNGKVINLPYESTPIDFAYRIHTDVGNRCIGSKVDGRIVPLDYKLQTGEIVEILTSTIIKGPNFEWLNTVKSNHAKSKIRDWFKKAKREENIEKGKELLERDSKRQGRNFKELAKGEKFENLLKKYNNSSIDELYNAVGTGNIIASSIVSKLIDSDKKEDVTLEELQDQIEKKQKNAIRKKTHAPGIKVKGESDILVRFAKCCSPIPGDSILGYITKGRGVSVHRRDCLNLENLILEDATRMIDVAWGEASNEEFIADIEIKGEDRPGFLNDVMIVITESKLFIQGVNARTSKKDIAFVNIKVKIQDIKQLNSVMRRLRKLKGVIDVYRTSN
ncbi:MAG: bifunctional (p)ppGpp synthetase/guanosine-3',5'-bis(diphosphate) 3'-pyrophosphohydrolase [Clostridiaceae bacterium]